MNPRVRVIVGPQEYFAERAIAAACSQWRAQSLDVVELSGTQTDIGLQLRSAAAPDLFGAAPGVVLREAEALDAPALAALLEAVADEPEVPWVLHHRGGKSSPKVRAALQQVADEVIKADAIKGRAVAEFVQQEFRSNAKTSDQAAIALLIDAVGGEPRALASAVEQLCRDIEDQHVGAEATARYYSGHVEVKGYQIADAVARRDLSAALSALRFALHEGGTSAGLMTTAALTTTLRRMAVAKTAPGGSAGSAEVAAALGIPEWMARQSVAQARGWSADEIADAVGRLAELSVLLKGGYRAGASGGSDGALTEEQKAYMLEQAIVSMAGARVVSG